MVTVSVMTGLQRSCMVSITEMTDLQRSSMVNVPELNLPPMELYGQCY